MVKHAENVKADAIVGMRYDATEFAGGATEVLAYGTAVRYGLCGASNPRATPQSVPHLSRSSSPTQSFT